MRRTLLCVGLALRRSGMALSSGAAARAAGPRQARIEGALERAFAPSVLEVLNESHGRHEDESHFKVVVVSEKFAGVKPLIKRHRMVNAAITADTDGDLDFHSLSVAAAKTPEEWAKGHDIAPSPKCAGGDGRGAKR
jgi:BolA protein